MADGGWIKLYRKLLDDELWIDCTPVQKVVMITLLLMANHAERKWIWKGKKFVAKPGQFVTSLDSIKAKAGNGVSVRAIRTSLDKFANLDFLTNESTKQGRLITIANWAKYQLSTDEVTNDLTVNRQSTDNQLTPNKNERSKEVNTTSISSPDSVIKDNFEKLWKLYPNKKGKQAAFKHYRALARKTKDPEFNRNIQTGIVAYKRYLVATNTESRYFKQGGTFFSQECWNDDWSTGPKLVDTADNAAPKFDAKQWAIATFTSNGSVSATIEVAKAEPIPVTIETIRPIIEDYWTHELGRDASSLPD